MSRRRPKVPPTPRRALLLLPSIPDALDEAAKNGMAVRNVASATGQCPVCGVRAEVFADPNVLGVWHGVFRHREGCPALLDSVAA